MASVSISWGLLEDDSPIHISGAERGADCNARCPGCRYPLIARKGLHKEWHFAHHPGSTCSGESVVHALVKHFLRTVPNPIFLPPLEAKVELQDLGGARYERSEQHYGGPYRLDEVKEEKEVAADLRPDCRATIVETDETLWIEVFFKNQKDEADLLKIQGHNISCIELDVSQLTFNSSYEEFIEAIFHRAPRKWLHHADLMAWQERLRRELELKIEPENQRFRKQLEDGCAYLSAIAANVAPFFTWPELSAGTGAAKLVKVPRLKAISPEWVKFGDAWQTKGVTQEKGIECHVVLRLAQTEDENVILPPQAGGLVKPSLLIEVRPWHSLEDPSTYRLSWHYISRWQQALVDKLLENTADRTKWEIAWRQRFRTLDAIEQQVAALELVGLDDDPTLRTGPFNIGWNCHRVTWRCLVINHHMLLDHYPSSLLVSGIAADRTLARVLGLSDEPWAKGARVSELYDWFRALHDDGLILEGRQSFTLQKPPEDIARFLRAQPVRNTGSKP